MMKFIPSYEYVDKYTAVYTLPSIEVERDRNIEDRKRHIKESLKRVCRMEIYQWIDQQEDPNSYLIGTPKVTEQWKTMHGKPIEETSLNLYKDMQINLVFTCEIMVYKKVEISHDNLYEYLPVYKLW